MHTTKRISAVLVLLCLCLMFHTSCNNNEETDSELQNNCPNSTDTPPIEYNTTLVEDNTNSQLEEADEELIDFLAHETWYSYFTDDGEKQVYTLRFYPSSSKMEWKIGYYESEWENTFVGSYSIGENHVFLAELYDALRDTEMQISFIVDASTIDSIDLDADKNSFNLTITDASLDKYKKMVNEPLYFSLDSNPNYPLETADFVIEQSIHSQNVLLHIVADRQMTLKDNILYDGSMEEYFAFQVLRDITEDDYLESTSDNMPYNKIDSFDGETTSGYLFHVYYNDFEIRKGQIVRCYKIFISVDETDMVLIDAYNYTFIEPMDVDDYWDEYIMPVVLSLDIEYIQRQE